MSYYDDPITFVHAQIASQTSILVDYTYVLNKVNSQIDTYQPDVPQELLDQQAQILNSIQAQQQVISNLQSTLVVDLSNNVVDLSNNVVDLSNNVVDLSNNVVDLSNNVVDLSNNVVDLSNNHVDLSNNSVTQPPDTTPTTTDLSNNNV